MLKFSPPHIIELEGNQSGDDYVGTDPHGNLRVLQRVVEALKGNDRLFLCGDLVDRGPQSFDLIRYVLAQNSVKKRIYAVRGNHEDLVLHVLNYLNFADEAANQEQCADLLNNMQDTLKIYRYGQNPQPFFDRLEDTLTSKIKTFNDKNYREKVIKVFRLAFNALTNGAHWAFNLKPNERKEVRDFIMVLPYQIQVSAVEHRAIVAFDIVHAVPLSESDIQVAKFTGNYFTEEQIFYMTWARPHSDNPREMLISVNGRTPYSRLTYVGHNSVEGGYPVYAQINVVNLDASTYFTQSMWIVNHSTSHLSLISAEDQLNLSDEYREIFNNCAQKIKEILFRFLPLYRSLYCSAYKKLTKSNDVFVVRDSDELPEVSLYQLRQFKTNFLTELQNRSHDLGEARARLFADYLKKLPYNTLAQKRPILSFFSKSTTYSRETTSMRQADFILNNSNTT
jgi:hypothetical protein